MHPDPDVLDLADRLRSYFAAHPRAIDTAEGIARFWMNAQPAHVERALQHLCALGEVRRVGVVGARHYEWVPRNRDE